MPFDVLTNQPCTLMDYLHYLGIRPVPLEQLDAHKIEQVRRNPGHVLATKWWPFLAMFAGYSLWAGYILIKPGIELPDLVIAFGSSLLLGGVLMTFVTASLVVMIGRKIGIPFKERARWIEHPASFRMAPEPISTVMKRIKQQRPDATFWMGELIQDDVVLDPYITVELGNERFCLGIWDVVNNKTKIIACAEMD